VEWLLQLAIAIGVNVTVRRLIEVLAQFRRVDNISIVGKADAVGRVGKEWLSLRCLFLALRWVPKMSNAHRSGSSASSLSKHGFSQAII
jgi:hypothetical protein